MVERPDLLSPSWLARLENGLLDDATEIGALVSELGLSPATIFSGRDLRYADLSGGQVLRGFSFANSDLTGSDFRGSDVSGACFHFSNLQRVRWDGARLEGASFFGALAAPSDWSSTAAPPLVVDHLDALRTWDGRPEYQSEAADREVLRCLAAVWVAVARGLRLQAIYVRRRMTEELRDGLRLEWAGRVSRNTIDADLASLEAFIGAINPFLLEANPSLQPALQSCRNTIEYFKRMSALNVRAQREAIGQIEIGIAGFQRAFVDLSNLALITQSVVWDRPTQSMAVLRYEARRLLLNLKLPDFAGNQSRAPSRARHALARLVWSAGQSAQLRR